MIHPNDHLSIKEIFSIAWRITRKHYWLLAIFTIVLFCISTASNLLSVYFNKQFNVGVSVLLGLFFLIAYTMVNLGLTKAIFWILDKDNEDFEMEQIQPNFLQIGNYLICTMLYFLIFAVGGFIIIRSVLPLVIWLAPQQKNLQLALCCVPLFPLVIVFLRLYFYQFFILDKNIGPLEAIRDSYRFTKRKAWRIFVLLFGFGVIYLVTSWLDTHNYFVTGVVLRVVNFFVVVPTTSVALVIIYRNLLQYNHPTLHNTEPPIHAKTESSPLHPLV